MTVTTKGELECLAELMAYVDKTVSATKCYSALASLRTRQCRTPLEVTPRKDNFFLPFIYVDKTDVKKTFGTCLNVLVTVMLTKPYDTHKITCASALVCACFG